MEDTNQILAMTKEMIEGDQLVNWNDDKRNDFVKTFDSRVRVARYILLRTAQEIYTKALEKHFISGKHERDAGWLVNTYANADVTLFDLADNSQASRGAHSTSYRLGTIGGRTQEELGKIAAERAKTILDSLPPLKQAVRLISPETADLIEQRDKLFEQGKKLWEETEELSGPLDMDDFPQETTLKAFRQQVVDREKKRLALVNKLDEIGAEGRRLDDRINKFLYSGLPGLSEAVIKVVKDYRERSTALAALNRRVEEQVRYGDSQTALELLRGFEQDEVKVSGEIKAQFDQAMEKLKQSAKKPAPKTLKAKPKSKEAQD